MTRSNSKYQAIATVIEERIRRGDYVLSGLQSDRAVAAEFGVARLTARQSIRLLIERGHIVRKSNGRLELPGAGGVPGKVPQIAFLAPSFNSPFLQRMRVVTERVAIALGYRFRPVDFLHWSDQVVHETLSSFDGVVIVPPSSMTAERILDRPDLANTGLLSLTCDLSGHGSPSFLIHPPAGVQVLCDHLAGLGHRRIDCLNVHAPSAGMQMRMQQWRVWCAAHDLPGELHDYALVDYSDPMQGGYDVMRQLLADKQLSASSILCTSELTSIGACRAMAEAGLTPGHEVSICTFGGDGACRFQTPSITCLEHEDPAPYLRLWCEWIGRKRSNWIGPLQLRLDDRLFHGESTAPPGGWPEGQRQISGPEPKTVPSAVR